VDAFGVVVEAGGSGGDVGDGHADGDGPCSGFEVGEFGPLDVEGVGDDPVTGWGPAGAEVCAAFDGFGFGELGFGLPDVFRCRLFGRVGDGPFRVVADGGVGVERFEPVVGSHVAKEVLLSPAGEHGVCEWGGVGVGACGDDLGLMPGCGVEADDLTAIEPAFGFVVGVRESDVPVGEEVGLGPTQIVNELVFCEPVTGFWGDLVFPVGRNVEPGRVELREQCRGPATPIKDDRRPPVGADQFADLGCDPFQLADQRRAGFGLPDQDPVPTAI